MRILDRWTHLAIEKYTAVDIEGIPCISMCLF